jgi:hypothetical protein
MNDTLAGNFLIDEADRVLLVDFEYASNNEQHLDAGVEGRGPAAEIGLDHLALDRLREGHLVEPQATWAMIQEAVSTLDFDYYKYGSWKHQRARTLFHHPDWPALLRREQAGPERPHQGGTRRRPRLPDLPRGAGGAEGLDPRLRLLQVRLVEAPARPHAVPPSRLAGVAAARSPRAFSTWMRASRAGVQRPK